MVVVGLVVLKTVSFVISMLVLVVMYRGVAVVLMLLLILSRNPRLWWLPLVPS